MAATQEYYRRHESDDVDSLPESESTVSEDVEISDAEREWRESLQQLELILTMVLIPYLGKYFGRKFAFWGWARYMEWKHPIKVIVTDPPAFKGAGHAAAASL